MEEEEIWKKNRCVNDQRMLSASRVKLVFLNLVKSAVEQLGYEGYANVQNIQVTEKVIFWQRKTVKLFMQLMGFLDISVIYGLI